MASLPLATVGPAESAWEVVLHVGVPVPPVAEEHLTPTAVVGTSVQLVPVKAAGAVAFKFQVLVVAPPVVFQDTVAEPEPATAEPGGPGLAAVKVMVVGVTAGEVMAVASGFARTAGAAG